MAKATDQVEDAVEYAVAVDKWCDAVRAVDAKYAAKTIAIPLTPADGRALARAHELSTRPPPSEADGIALAAVGGRIGGAIDELGGRAFVKLSTRSPKDVVYDDPNPAVDAALEAELERVAAAWLQPAAGGEPASRAAVESAAVEAWLTSCAAAFECRSASAALAMLLSSTRISWDLNRALEATGADSDAEEAEDSDRGDEPRGRAAAKRLGAELLPLSIVVREWLPCPVWSEYRCFVHAGELTAVSQYYHLCCFREAAADAAAAECLIRAAHAALGPVLRTRLGPAAGGYVMDLRVEPAEGRVQLLEVNPFEPATSGCLFDWAADTDAAVLRGRAPFEMRVRSTPRPGVVALAVPRVRERLQAWVEAYCGTGAGSASTPSACSTLLP